MENLSPQIFLNAKKVIGNHFFLKHKMLLNTFALSVLYISLLLVGMSMRADIFSNNNDF